MSILQNPIKSAIIGLAVGDALGVPVEFRSRDSLQFSPVTDMGGYGTHHQPPGTWSDDSSMTFCLMESLINGYDLQDMGQKFQDWFYKKYWTPHGQVFDFGNATAAAIKRLREGYAPQTCGGIHEGDNGNGSLMRILPLAFYIHDKPITERFAIVRDVSSITHGHFRSVLSCFIYLELVIDLLHNRDKETAYEQMQKRVNQFISSQDWNPKEVQLFDRILKIDISMLPMEQVSGSGYVLHSLEASIWCLLHETSYEESVLKAVNLGDDTDTTAAITGGLAGLVYGFTEIPSHWIEQLARLHDVLALIARFSNKFPYPPQ